jgi:hypothetical protein
MTTTTSRLQTERDDIAREYAAAPRAQQDLLALLSEQTPPPADGETPPMPADLLERLRGHYGSTAEAPEAENIFTAPRPAAPTPGMLQRIRSLFSVPAFQWGGLATACLAVILGVFFMKSPPSAGGDAGGGTDVWRGNPPPVAQTGPLYVWIGTAGGTDRAGVADKVPGLLDAASEAAALEISRTNPEATIYTLNAAAGSVQTLVNGEVQLTQPLRAGAAASAENLLDALRKAQRNTP